MSASGETFQLHLEQAIKPKSPDLAQGLQAREGEKVIGVEQFTQNFTPVKIPFLKDEGIDYPQRLQKDFEIKHGDLTKRREKKHTGRGLRPQHLQERAEKSQTVSARTRLNQFALNEALLDEAVDDEDVKFNITEYGIDESNLSSEQIELLDKVRTYAQNISKTYQTAMRELMAAYKIKNPKFTDNIMRKMMNRGYDLPAFSIYSPESAQEFFSQQTELGIDSISGENFLVIFNLPRPIGRMWYKGGVGTGSKSVPKGAIEWGGFYRRTMPVIWNAIDAANKSNDLTLRRLNQYSQHDPKRYYYLYEAELMPEMDNEPENHDDYEQYDS